MISLNGQRFYANRSTKVCRLMCERGDRGLYTVTQASPPAAPGPVVLMTWGQPADEPRPRRLFMAAHSDPPPAEAKPRRLTCCQIVAAVTALLVFYVVLLMAILYATGSMDALSTAAAQGRRGQDAQGRDSRVVVVDDSSVEIDEAAAWRGGGVDVGRLRFLHSPSATCAGERPYLAAFVHSAPAHARHRAVVRRTWGSVGAVDGADVRVVFVVGRPADADADGTQALIDAEARQFSDIVQADFVDTYRNLTLKHLVGHRWMLAHCARARFVVKADDDAFVDVFQLVRFMRRTHGDSAPGALVCNVLPAGTPVMREGKWAVSRADFAASVYPRFCGGLLYLAEPETVARLYRAARRHPHPLWVDDAFVTGLAAESAGVEHFYMNLRYTYDPAELERWVEGTEPHPLPYMVGHMDTLAKGWAELALRLWQKTLRTSRRA